MSQQVDDNEITINPQKLINLPEATLDMHGDNQSVSASKIWQNPGLYYESTAKH